MNINDTVYVRLTPTGRNVEKLEGRWCDNEREGYWQLWRLMQVFGPLIHMGMRDALFERNELHVWNEYPYSSPHYIPEDRERLIDEARD